jgi:hypothetical protein
MRPIEMRSLMTLIVIAAFAAALVIRAADTTSNAAPSPKASVSSAKKHAKKSTVATSPSPAPTPFQWRTPVESKRTGEDDSSSWTRQPSNT